MNAQIVVF